MKESTASLPPSSVQRKGKRRRRTSTEKRNIFDGSNGGTSSVVGSDSSDGGGGGGLFGFLNKINKGNSHTNAYRHTKKNPNGHSLSELDIDNGVEIVRRKRKLGENDSNDNSQQARMQKESKAKTNRNLPQLSPSSLKRSRCNTEQNDFGSISVLAGIPPPPMTPSKKTVSVSKKTSTSKRKLAVTTSKPASGQKERNKQKRPTNIRKNDHCIRPPTAHSHRLNNDQIKSNWKNTASDSNNAITMSNSNRNFKKKKPKSSEATKKPRNCNANSATVSASNTNHSNSSHGIDYLDKSGKTEKGKNNHKDNSGRHQSDHGSCCSGGTAVGGSSGNIRSNTSSSIEKITTSSQLKSEAKSKISSATKKKSKSKKSSICRENIHTDTRCNDHEKEVRNEKKNGDDDGEKSDEHDPSNCDNERTASAKVKIDQYSKSSISERNVISPSESIESECSIFSSLSLSLSRSLSSESSTSASTSTSALSLSSSLTEATKAMREKVKKGVKIKRRSRYNPPRTGNTNSKSKSNPRLTPRPKTIVTTASKSSSSSLSSKIDSPAISVIKDIKSWNKSSNKQHTIDNQSKKIVEAISHGKMCNESIIMERKEEEEEEEEEEKHQQKIESNYSSMVRARTRQRPREENQQQNGHYSSIDKDVKKISTEEKNNQAELKASRYKFSQRSKSDGFNEEKGSLGVNHDNNNGFCEKSSIVMNTVLSQVDKGKLIIERTGNDLADGGTIAVEKDYYDNTNKDEINAHGTTKSTYDEELMAFIHNDDDTEEIQTTNTCHRRDVEDISCTNYENDRESLGTLNKDRSKNREEEVIEDGISTEKNDENAAQATRRLEFDSVLSSLERKRYNNEYTGNGMNHEYESDKKGNIDPPQLKKTVGQVRETTRKRCTLTLAKTLNTGRKIILVRPKETQQKQVLKEKSIFSSLPTASVPIVTRQRAVKTPLKENEKGAATSSLERISRTAAVKSPRKRHLFVGLKPSTSKKPDGNVSRADLAKQLNPNLASALVSKSRKILESKKFYASPPLRRPSMSPTKAMKVHQVTPSLPPSEEESRTKLSLHEHIVHVQREELETNFEVKWQCIENGPTERGIKTSEVLSYIDGKIKQLQDIRLIIKQKSEKKKEIGVNELKQLCEATLVEGILTHQATIEKVESSLVSESRSKSVANRPRNYIPWKRGQRNERERSIQNNAELNRPRSQSYKTSANDGKLTESRFTSRSRIQFASDKAKSQSMNQKETPTREATCDVRNGTEKEPILSPYGTTWLELKLDLSSSEDKLDLSSSDDDNESSGNRKKKRVRSGGNEKYKRTRILETENDDDDNSSAHSESENSTSISHSQSDATLSSICDTTPFAKSRNVSGMDSLQKLGCHSSIEYYQ